MNYRKEIDGLRSLAIIPVIIFHSGFGIFPGGFLGVDVFFVISGYLITHVILKSFENDRLSLFEFYARRIRRIFPALLVVVICSLLCSILILTPEEMFSMVWSGLASLYFWSNIFFWRDSGYFSIASELKPLIHTWSLSVEEQFYMFFPFLWIIFKSKNHKMRLLLIILILTMSLSLAISMNSAFPVPSYYLLPTRAWELLVGSIACFIRQSQNTESISSITASIFSKLGLLLLLTSLLYFGPLTPHPSEYTIVPILGVALILIYTRDNDVLATFLKNRVIVAIGLMSYSLYLWHQPILAFYNVHYGSKPNGINLFFVLTAIFSCGYFCWKYVEQPFRYGNGFLKRNAFFVLGLMTTVVSATFLFILFNQATYENLWLKAQNQNTQKMYSLLKDARNNQDFTEMFPTNCRKNFTKIDSSVVEIFKSCAAQYGKAVVVLGDSHAMDLHSMLISRFQHPFIFGIAAPGCRTNKRTRSCDLEEIRKFTQTNSLHIQKIIFEQAGFTFLTDNSIHSGKRDMFKKLIASDRINVIEPDNESIQSTAQYLKQLSGSSTVLWFGPRIEHHLSDRFLYSNHCSGHFEIHNELAQTFQMLDEHLHNYVQRSGLEYTSQIKTLAINFGADLLSCEYSYWTNSDHYSSYGEERFGKRLPEGIIQ